MAPESDALLSEPIRLAGDEGGDRARIRAKASALVEAALRVFPDARPPPFRPEIYTELLGIPVIYSRDLAGWDALLVPTPAGYRILCNERMPASRRAFTLCHEVGHTFFAGSQEKRYFLRTKQRKSYLTREKARLERACDMAAARRDGRSALRRWVLRVRAAALRRERIRQDERFSRLSRRARPVHGLPRSPGLPFARVPVPLPGWKVRAEHFGDLPLLAPAR
jgi:hypothetical protein